MPIVLTRASVQGRMKPASVRCVAGLSHEVSRVTHDQGWRERTAGNVRSRKSAVGGVVAWCERLRTM